MTSPGEGGAVPEIVGGVAVLLLVASGVLGITKRLRFPFTIALVLTGLGLCAVGDRWAPLFEFLGGFELSPGLILYLFLPTLIFESAYNLDARALWHNIGSVLMLAVPGLVLSTVIIGVLVTAGSTISLPAALLLGAILSATDPVAVIALFRQLGAPDRLTILVEGESLFNDATSMVLAKVLLGVVLAGAVTVGQVAGGLLSFVVLFAGGILFGWLLGALAGWLLGWVDSDPYIEITLTTVVAYLSFLVAEEVFQVSGVMATVGAGLTLGGWGRYKISPGVRTYLEHFWEYMSLLHKHSSLG